MALTRMWMCVYGVFLLAMFRGGFCKIYERCELARELKTKHKIPEAELATWVCLARHESEFNTSAVNQVSGDHGLFQISQLFWCSPPGEGHACGLSCAQLKDDDIKDDVICARRIYREHKRLSGDGFNAWVVYRIHCTGGQVAEYTKGCFEAAYNMEPDSNNEVKLDSVQQPASVNSGYPSEKLSVVTTEPTTSQSTISSVSTSTAYSRFNGVAKLLSANYASTGSLEKEGSIKAIPAVNYFPYVNNVAKQVAIKPPSATNYPNVNNIAIQAFEKPALDTTSAHNLNVRKTSSGSTSNFPYKGFRIINGKVTYY